MIEVRCFHSLEEAAVLRAEVNALNLASARPDPFSTFEFYENFLLHDEFFPCGEGLRVWFLAALEAGRLVGYLVLKEVLHRVLGAKTPKLEFLVEHDTDRPHLVARAEQAVEVSGAIYDYLLTRRDEWSLLELKQQDASSPLFPPPRAVDLSSYLVREWPSMQNGTIRVQWPTLAEYFSFFSKKFRSNVSRQMRTLFEAGEVTLFSSSDPATTRALFELYRTIEPRSWKSSHADAAIGRHPRRIEYFKGLLEARSPMRVSIHVLCLDGVPIGGLINGSFGRGLYALHIVFDDALNRLGPGSAVLLMGMRQAIEGKYAFFNLLSGFGYYKVRWLAEMTATRSAQIYRVRVGKPFFWRALLGNLKRQVLPTEAEQEFNPVRRKVSEEAAGPTDGALKPSVNPLERERIDALTAQVRLGTGEFLSAAELAAAMPFETQRRSRRSRQSDPTPRAPVSVSKRRKLPRAH